MIESIPNKDRVGEIRVSIESAIAALPSADGNKDNFHPHSQMISATLTNEGVEHIDDILHEQGVLDEDVSIGQVVVRPYSYFPSYDKVGEVAMFLYPKTPEMQQEALQVGDNGPCFLIHMTPLQTSVTNLAPAPKFVGERAHTRHQQVVNRFISIVEAEGAEMLLIFNAVKSAIVPGKAVRVVPSVA